MKKITIFFLGILLSVSTLQAAAVLPPTSSPEADYEIGYGVKISYDQLKTLTAKEYKKLTGHRLGVRKSFALKLIQKNLPASEPYSGGGKSQLAAALLAFFLGGLGIHRFYLGYTWQGIVQLLTLGGFGIWALIDFIRILTGDLQPKDGEYAKTL